MAFTPLTFQGEISTNDSLARALIQLQSQINSISASSVSFGTIAVSGQSNVVAAIAADTLNIAAGSNITLTTTPGTNTVTIAASGGSSGITIGTTAVSSGTATRLLYETSTNKVGEISGATSDGTTLTMVAPVLGIPASGTLTNCTGLPPAGVVGTAAILGANTFTALQTITQASSNAGIIASTGYSLSGSDATSMVSLSGTLNTSGSPDVFKISITDTARGGSTTLFSINAGASGTTNVFNIDRLGNVTIPNANLAFSTGTKQAQWVDVGVCRNASGVLEINNLISGNFRDLKLRNLIPGATLSTSMTDGFINIPGAAGAAAGTPNNTTGFPIYWDSTNLQLYVYTGGAWKKSAAFS